jgi:acetyl esterase/lipase
LAQLPATQLVAPGVRPLLSYFSDTDPEDPLVSPFHSPEVLAKFPPTLIITGTFRQRAEPKAAFWLKSQAVQHAGFCVKVSDAVGAGDGFTACLAHYYLQDYSLEDLSEFANRFASWVATQRGATPASNTTRYKRSWRVRIPAGVEISEAICVHNFSES